MNELTELLKEVERCKSSTTGVVSTTLVDRLAEKAISVEAELSSLRDSCEAQRVEIEGLKNLLNERSS